MAAVAAKLVKELRDRTGLGMMECKKALVAADGDIEVAADDLRKSGAAKADKKASRTAAEGAIAIVTDGSVGLILEINSETDFAAKEENFKAFVSKVADAALAARETDVDKIKELTIDGGTVETARAALVQKIGENIQVRRAQILEAEGALGGYIHGGKIGALVSLTAGDEELGKNVAMHVAAANPLVVNGKDVPEETLDREKAIIKAQPDMEGKPEEIIEKMLGGRINKFLKEVSLVEQPFIKDPDTTVGKLVKAAGAEVSAMVRFEVGDGIEVVKVDFADEVAAQLGG